MPSTDAHITAGIIAKRVGDELVLLDLERGLYYGLDSVGARIWELLEDGKPVASVIETLADEFEVDRAVLEQDVARLLETLRGRGLITGSL